MAEEKVSAHKLVLEHLQNHGSITSKEAWEQYGTTRLSSIIGRLRKFYDIETVMEYGKNRYKQTCGYARYTYHGEIQRNA